MFKERRYLYVLGIFVLINAVLIGFNIFLIKGKKSEISKLLELRQSNEAIRSDEYSQKEFYNLDCPEIAGDSVGGEKIDIRDYAGNVIILQFSRFFREDLPNIIYLQNLAAKYRKYGTFLLFIDTRGKHDSIGVGKFITLSYPVIEDDGTIRARLNAYPEDTIIINRYLKIKYKSSKFAKRTIYDEVVKQLDINTDHKISHESRDSFSSLKDLVFYDVFNKRTSRIINDNKNKLVTFFTSICTSCDENRRIQLLRELAEKISPERGEIFLIFGKGNTLGAIKQYAIAQEWNNLPINIGIIEDAAIYEDLYFDLFNLDIDPKTFVFDSTGKAVFIETRKNAALVNLDSLIRMTK
jgi:thiol-disulfide isomerase/thioredoxin